MYRIKRDVDDCFGEKMWRLQYRPWWWPWWSNQAFYFSEQKAEEALKHVSVQPTHS